MPLKVRMSSARQLLLAALLFPPLGLAPWPACAQTMIDLTYDSTMDMVRPEPHPGIIVHHNLEIFLPVRALPKIATGTPGNSPIGMRWSKSWAGPSGQGHTRPGASNRALD